MDCAELMVPRECCNASVLLLSASSQLASWPRLFSKQRLPLLYFITSQMHPVLYHSVQSKAFHISPLQCEFLKITLSCLLCSTHLTWRENVWLDKSYRSHPPLLILPKSSLKMLCVCVQVRKDMERHGSGRAHWNLVDLRLWDAADCIKGKVSSGAPQEQHGTCGWQRHGAEDGVGLSWSARASPSIYRNIYTQIHIKSKSCFTPLTHTTSVTASYPLCQKPGLFSCTYLTLTSVDAGSGPEAALPTALCTLPRSHHSIWKQGIDVSP